MELPVPDGLTLIGYANDIAAILLGSDVKELQTRADAVVLFVNNWLHQNHLELTGKKLILDTHLEEPQISLNILRREIPGKIR